MKSNQEQFEEACRLRDEGDLVEAQRLLEALIVNQPGSAALFAVLGGVYWDRGLLDDAVSSFRTAAQLAPHSEVVSLGLFHTLWESGQEDMAFDEMKRFTATYDSDEYKMLVKQILESEADTGGGSGP